MPVGDILARVQELQSLAQRASAPVAPAPDPTGFAAALSGVQALPQAPASATSLVAPAALPPTLLGPTSFGAAPDSAAGLRALAVAQGEVGVAEDPPGSNNGARIADYRTATRGAYEGAPWCAYFASWVAAQSGVPLGEEGQGYGSVAEVEAWARRTGRFVEPGSAPQPGDLILYGDRHMGIVEAVEPDGSLRTIEGNYSDGVGRVKRSPSEATGFVRLG